MPKLDLNINQNASFRFSFSLANSDGTPKDISGWEFRGAIKLQVSDPDPPVLRFICVGTNSDLYSIPVDPENPTPSKLEIKLSAAQTELLTERRYVYDIIGIDTVEFITTQVHPEPNPEEPPTETVYRLLEGAVRVNPGVTDRDPTQ